MCAHIFLKRLQNGVRLYKDGDVPDDCRWAIVHTMLDVPQTDEASFTFIKGTVARSRTKTEKYRYASAVRNQLAEEMSDCGEQLFRQYIQCCEQLVNNVKEKTLCVLSVHDHALDDDDAVQAVGSMQTSGEVEVSTGDNN